MITDKNKIKELLKKEYEQQINNTGKILYSSMFDKYKTQTLRINFDDMLIESSKEGQNEDNNLKYVAKIVSIHYKHEHITKADDVYLVFPIKSFLRMFRLKGINLDSVSGFKEVSFKILSQREYELISIKELI